MAKDTAMTRAQLEQAAKQFGLVLITEADAAEYRDMQCHALDRSQAQGGP